MANKKFISFLGTTNYVQVKYGSADAKPTRFVQESLIDKLCTDWSENDQILIFYTDESKTKNWLNNGQPEKSIKEDVERIGLEQILTEKKKNGLKPKIESFRIEEGFSEKEVWDIFDCVYNKLEEDDEIYFDVTHAFRSIPLFSTILFNFSKFTKNTKLCGVYYGAFEKLGTAFNVREIPLKDRIAPIIDLTSIINLQDLTNTASGIKQYGKTSSVELLIKKATNNLEKTKANNRFTEALKTIKECTSDLDHFILANRMKDIEEGKFVKDFNAVINKSIQSDNLNNAEREIFKTLKDLFSNFKPEKNTDNIEAAIEWAYKYDMLPQAYTLAEEYIISLCCIKLNDYAKEFNKEKDFRTFVSGTLQIKKEDIDSGNLKNELKDHDDVFHKIIKYNWITGLRPAFKKLADNRNIINHAKKGNYKDLHNQFRNYYDDCIAILKKHD
ncbi:MAG: TIGR02221 family CRISPR-associated protein [Paludibacteraceae bacterium]|nr:TIGR02221 family CRISPR-associated protein [Paludibacteraceae bacterium]